jgi:cytochrome c-type protein NapC
MRPEGWLQSSALAFAVAAALILIWYLVWHPPLGRVTKGMLLLGFGVFPIGAAVTGNVTGYQRTMQRDFCGSCHTMGPWVADSNDPKSTSLAAIHARNPEFGEQNCYRCHEDYEMFGTIATKLDGLRHVWLYYTRYRTVPVADAIPRIHLYVPFANATCMHCHSTETPIWNEVPEHTSSAALVRSGAVSCASAGCHGPAHPFAAAAAEGHAR